MHSRTPRDSKVYIMANKIVKAPLFSNDATAQVEAGSLWFDEAGDKAYRYVLVEDANLSKGDVVEFSDVTGYEVTKDRVGGSSLGRFVAGVAITTITDGQYGWIQVSGVNNYVKTDGGVALGDRLVPHASSDGVADTEANGSTVVVTSGQVFGFALNTDTATTTTNCKAYLRCL